MTGNNECSPDRATNPGCPTFSLAGFGAAVAPLLVEFVVLFAVAAGLTYLVSHK